MLFTGCDLSPSSGQQAALPVSGILPSRVYGFYILSPVLGAPSLSSLGPVLTGGPSPQASVPTSTLPCPPHSLLTLCSQCRPLLVQAVCRGGWEKGLLCKRLLLELSIILKTKTKTLDEESSKSGPAKKGVKMCECACVCMCEISNSNNMGKCTSGLPLSSSRSPACGFCAY